MFVDNAKIKVFAGKGGNGIVSFRREKFVPRGGPNGGDGGRGGDIIAMVDPSLRTLADYRYKTVIKADNGADGEAWNRSGKSAEDLILKFPQGTMIFDDNTGDLVADLVDEDVQVVLAKGGPGGRGNSHFATPIRQAPRYAENGLPGQEKALRVELKLLADVGLVGYPNAGKSTLISVVTAAKPKIANYPFTTLSPVLGVVENGDDSFVIADIPGLIEGASSGAGLGHEFLRHVQRTKVLVHVVDAAGTEGRDPVDDFHKVRKELGLFDEAMLKKPFIVAANKADLIEDKSVLERLKEASGTEVYLISAATTKGIGVLMGAVARLLAQEERRLRELAAIETAEGGEKVYVLRGERLRDARITHYAGAFVLSGEGVERLILRTDINNPDALKRMYGMLIKSGIIGRLREMDIKEGDLVRVLDYEFEYSEGTGIGV
ncbi:MAG TPA: GTPase ObgE [Bacillota bacterium]|nr:MAG: GTPase ObgE [Firmicutes bacterium ADurb.Bin153]HNV34357.1 GTPase ObgE [Bacillota bacterium]